MLSKCTSPSASQRPRPGLHRHPLAHFLFLPCLHRACLPGCGIVWGCKHTHVIRTPDQRRRPTACLSIVPLCRWKPAGVRTPAERRGLGRGLRTKILVTQRSPQTMMLKEAPGGGWAPARCGRCKWGNPGSAEKKTLIPVVSAGGDSSSWERVLYLPSHLAGGGWHMSKSQLEPEGGSDFPLGTETEETKMMWEGAWRRPETLWGTVSARSEGRWLSHSCLQQTFPKPLLCAGTAWWGPGGWGVQL